ncbi:ras association domain-containing protein 6 isoform X2 [Rhinatrema bivittatum]|uniref:ras association domain-containing protein 6 isoform X2 n=1 Tax=Rhinatrema bivittatum TaxID=194408 RepID=UPI00112AB045|nr:ras association domain-containing protein 6 isoform X2 [Rhinatrema bivittatum]
MRNQLTSLLKTYNCYYEDQKNMQLSFHQEQGQPVVIAGLLEILWGVQRPIRFMIQDEKQTPSSALIELPEPVGSSISKSVMIRWGEFEDLYHISDMDEMVKTENEETNGQEVYPSYDNSTLRPKGNVDPDSPSLYRTMSDAALVKKRIKPNTAERRETQHHRFSINGHFYNYKTSIFTPAFGSQTKVSTNSNMKTEEVIEQLLHKFKIENSPHEFALYIIHASGEKKRLKSTDYPLWERILQGPSGKIARFFLMDRDAEEVSSDVAQYIKFNLPILESILQKLNEEEMREIQKTIAKYHKEKTNLLQHLHGRRPRRTETTV